MIKIKRFSFAAVVAIIFAGVWALVTTFPFLFMAFTSFKQTNELFQGPTIFALPKSLYLDNYTEILTGNFFIYFKNSILVCAIGLILLLASSAMASYVFSRLKFKINKVLFAIVIACMAIPIHATLIPVFLLTKDVKLYDNIIGLIGPYVAFNIPVSVFILTGFMKGIPVELEQAADVDGAGKVRTFLEIILPLSMPGLATLAIYNGINMWNEFVYAFVLTSSVKSRTLPLAIWEYQGQYGVDIPMVMTILTLSALPMIIVFIFCQEKLIKGMMAGAVKG
ncbi:carbohydrate ABC transporter permease [Ruminiclostridium cellulolyticum]|uniref:Binding-protein-dependent transport systems inner membrane component n=1 Tax=Ruminiclostridium cellulolyticum (strain ATCC 35319 / DSM 5812 / JCM 6584 / H10) TaxID=394503 RepID=B8I9C9_RUMCH|nr:carbohydrate ABC transporter permease [Ruminiclostridium cellulolyticum]ACL75389.1 binding-protein-dependent transport systems inner membrane component [Ruminiclostridium cellulolyticum H10]